ncbi:unnamed protein product [Callosobruchus maculatus]|uniref:Carboxylic ester hydrolase n=1 Tax=Callosobruchus maculatus TaxID=64391 RepID=A0A653DKX8_CALMS|nr:unnamed protein product [Callosobruchus maculatus]
MFQLKQENLSVLVYIHGGAFVGGNSSYQSFPPDLFLEENLIFVMFNYRLGVFGFISTEDLVVPGNNGLKDQVLALKWVQKNIHYFGGNPGAVTIFGESAGAASVSYHTLSPSSKGLFKAAIMDSGSSLCLWALNRRARRTAFTIGRSLFLNTFTSQSLIDGLTGVDYVTLQEVATVTSNLITSENPLAGIFFGPVIEPYHDSAFFYNKSEELLRTGQFNRVPVLMGINSNEAVAANEIPAVLRLFFAKYDINVALIAPEDLTNDTKKRKDAAKEIKSYFFKTAALTTANPQSFSQFISDDQFNRPVRQTALDMRKYVDVYFYQFSYEGHLGRKMEIIEPDAGEGVGHGEELGYLFTHPSIKDIPQNDTLMQKQVVQMWSNFAKYKTAYKGTPYYSFRGIPYAEPPIGNLRFKPPVEKSKWNGTLDATREGSQCVQNINPVLGSEDCLFINVYTPSLKQENLSVLVFIHGGAFINGNSSYEVQPPDLFLEENLVFVMFNYRLGVFGFISTEDLVVLALKWVQKNIHYFGGNPEAVTVFGQSAGAASVSYHTQSPSSKASKTAFTIGKNLFLNTSTSQSLWKTL